MICNIFSFRQTAGWSCDKFPDTDSENTLILIFGASQLLDNDNLIEQISKAFPKSIMMGCSTSGEIFGREISDDSLTVAIVKFEKVRLYQKAEYIADPSHSEFMGRQLGLSLRANDLKGVFILTDGLHVNGSSLIRGLMSGLNANVPVSGGMAADGEKFQRTWVLVNGKPESNHVAAVGFYGSEFCFETTSKGGWDVFGPDRTVTRAHDNILYELDGKPALQLYKEYLGELAQGLPATGLLFPISIIDPESNQEIVRTIIAVNDIDNSLTLAGDVPQGALAKLMHANPERLINGASDAAEALPNNPCCSTNKLVIAISCFGRRAVLKERSEEEIEAVLSALPNDVNLLGFYSYGEFSPTYNGTCTLHNQTMTLTMIGE